MEKYTQVFLKEDDQRILPGKSFSFDFEYSPESNKEHRIFFTGEVDNFYYWKSEYGCTPICKRIDESLVPGTIGPWGLKFVGADYPIIACHKITWPPVLGYLTLKNHTEQWNCGVSAKATNFRLLEGGYLHLIVEVRNKRPGVYIKQSNFRPDRTFTIEVKSWRWLCRGDTFQILSHLQDPDSAVR